MDFMSFKIGIGLAIFSIWGLVTCESDVQPSIEAAPVSTTTEVTYPMNPFMLEPLSADMHDTESSVPEMAVLPEGITREAVRPTSTTTTTTIALPEGKCSEWYPTALEAGWELDELTKVGRIAWAESRCTHDIANKTYSYGLMQIEWSAHQGWLKTEFGITERDALFDPYTNLLVSRWLFDYADEHYGCGWQPWYMSGEWC